MQGKRAAIYARFSTDLQSERSVDDQIARSGACRGEFKLGDGRYCYPLTVTDQASR